MKEWQHDCNITIKEEPYINNLSRFTVYQDDKLIGSFYPLHIDEMNWLIAELDKGVCPVCDGWEVKMKDKCEWRKASEDPFLETW